MQHSYNNKLIKKVRETITRYSMLKHGDRVLAGVSGGPDSVCLIHLLKELSEEYGLSLHIAHLHHGFRGVEADEDVRFVQAIGESLAIPVHIEHADIPSYIRKARLSKQAGAREVRYKFFNKVASEIKADRIALGHTADDQAETFLMRLIRGSGSHGLSGIPPVRGIIIRPLIEVYREEIKGFLSENDIRYRIDSSNLSAVYLRNKIRRELIPYLIKEYNPNIMETLMRNLNILREEDIFLTGYVESIYRALLVRESKGSIQMDAGKLSALAKPVRRRALRQAVESIAGEGAVPVSFQHIEDSLSLLDSSEGGEIHLPGGIMVRRDGGAFWVCLKTGMPSIPTYVYNIVIPGDTVIPEAEMTVSTAITEGLVHDKEEEKKRDRYKAYFDMKKISLPLTVRNRRTGDLFHPSGMGGKKKRLKEYFIDLKIPRGERDRIPILTSPDGILWVVGYRTDERFKATTGTEAVLQVTAVKSAA